MSAPQFVTSFRMYEAGARAAQAWRKLFERVFADAGVEVAFLEHGHPQPLADLWTREGLLSAFMCGRPFALSDPGLQAVAAPVPSPARYQSLPRYCSDYVAREDSGWQRLEEAFGSRFGWMAPDSQSGFHAARNHLAMLDPRGEGVFAESIGPLGNPRKCLEALQAGEVDVVALDSYYLDLARRHDPALVENSIVIGHTPWTPIPLLVAAPGVEGDVVERVREVLLECHEAPGYGPLLEHVLLKRFAVAEVSLWRTIYGRKD
jgi:ABC-type phosphate/phosphonate transport system substrate-binding protein